MTVMATAGACGEQGPWYETEPSDDLSYLPLGDVAFDERALAWSDDGGSVDLDGYLPALADAPAVVFLPGAGIVKERYRWLGATLASHGIAAFVVEPNALFGTAREILGTIDYVASAPDLSIDVSRVALAGHSAGALAPVGLTDVASCPPGVCTLDQMPPRGLRGLILLGYHNQTESATASEPMAAVDVPWLLLSGSRDGLATPERVATTVARLEDRPIYALEVDGLNHFQLTDYVDLETDVRLSDDLEPTRGNREARALAADYIARFARRVLLGDPSVAEDLGSAGDDAVSLDYQPASITYPTGHGLPPVHALARSFPDLAAADDIVATAEYQGDLYLLVRNNALGAQLWRFSEDETLELVPFPNGATHGFYDNPSVNGLFGALIEFKGELWVGVSTGSQGGQLGAATGAELWTYNGQTWRPVISRVADEDLAVVVSGLDGCAEGDGDTTAVIRTEATFAPATLAGAILDDIGAADAGEKPVQLRVTGNTANSLSVQVMEFPGQPAFTQCEGLEKGRTLWLRQGADESGFGDPWNKAIIDLEIYRDRLYVAIGLNLDFGASLWATEDGVDFTEVIAPEFYGSHDNGNPISSSISDLYRSSITGEDVLYVGSTGTEGYGARLLALTDDGLEYIIDDSVDDNDTGLDEAGAGGESHQIASMLEFNGSLWLASQSFTGMEMFSMDPSGALTKHVGEGMELGLGWGDDKQIAGKLSVIDDQLWVATSAFIQAPTQFETTSGFALRTADGDNWQLASAHAFGINAVRVSQIFDFAGKTYAVTSGAALATPRSFRPLRIYNLTDRRN